MKILVTLEQGRTWDIYYSPEICAKLESFGEVVYNKGTKPFTPDELKHHLEEDITVCLTHWGCPSFNETTLVENTSLRFIAHGAGTVADLVSDYVYQKGIKVSSSNDVMAKFVAEGCMAYILSALRLVPEADRLMKQGEKWPYLRSRIDCLYYKKISLIGFGAVARNLCKLLRPFEVYIQTYDPFITKEDMESSGFGDVKLVSFEEALSAAEIISLHMALTPETVGLIGETELKMIGDGALLLNTSRGKVIDEKALIDELSRRRFRAVLDVYEKEPLPLESPLRTLDNVILIPHLGGSSSKRYLTLAMLEEIECFIKGEPLRHAVSSTAYSRMTRHL
jgi:phosphoglycerate dehydrogenase-like enzyme